MSRMELVAQFVTILRMKKSKKELRRSTSKTPSNFDNIVAIGRKSAQGKKLALRRRLEGKKAPYKVPPWFSKLKTGSHGNTPSQKKAWKVVSDYVRKRDWEKYGGFCSDGCGTRIEHWQDGDCGHWKAWSVCHGLFKYELTNLAFQSSNCNRLSDGRVGYGLGETLKIRWGNNHLDWIEFENEKYRGKKIEEWELVEMVAKLAPELVHD